MLNFLFLKLMKTFAIYCFIIFLTEHNLYYTWINILSVTLKLDHECNNSNKSKKVQNSYYYHGAVPEMFTNADVFSLRLK